jgi:diguanylate cyclase (GGDEF)-like protein
MSGSHNHLFEGLVEASHDFIGTVDRKGLFLYLNPAGRRILEIPLDEDIVGQSIGPYNDIPSAELAGLASAILDDGTMSALSVFVSRSGRRIPVSQSFIVHETPTGTCYSTIARDVSERLALETLLRDRADRDPLTGLFNRSAFRRLAETWLSRPQAEAEHPTHSTNAVLAMLDLDGFKAVNDTHGHHTGDQLLIQVADVLKATLEPHCLVARLGGDEFVILSHDDALMATVRATLRPVLDPYGADVSVGTAHVLPQDLAGEGDHLERVMQEADANLYQQKRIRRFTPKNGQPTFVLARSS